MFNILVIVALSAAVATQQGTKLPIDWRIVARDVSFYTASILLLGAMFIDGEIAWWEGLILMMTYMVYVIFMKYNERILGQCAPPKEGVTDPSQVDFTEGKPLTMSAVTSHHPSLSIITQFRSDSAKMFQESSVAFNKDSTGIASTKFPDWRDTDIEVLTLPIHKCLHPRVSPPSFT
ncbi:unnamed protein product [Choristocarpus tenellus]